MLPPEPPLPSLDNPKPSKGWSPQRRAAQAARILHQKPWLHSTGPRTEAGKSRSAANATTHGMTSLAAQDLRDALRIHTRFLNEL